MMAAREAPEWQVEQWLNCDEPLTLAAQRGRVVVIEAFQMLCPGCVSHGLPQAARIAETFTRTDVTVVGMHCVFEHHEAQTAAALKAFMHEYRVAFPVGIDSRGGSDGVPQTMAAYRMRGTPTLVLIDRLGRRRAQYFGQVGDLQLGAEIAALLGEGALDRTASDAAMTDPDGCGAGSCIL